MRILVTGAAGFIGSHVCQRLLERGDDILGIDNLNNYYEVALKESRLANLCCYDRFRFMRVDITDRTSVERLFQDENFDRVIHFAAQAGVRYSLSNPHTYIDTNVAGFTNIIEGCRLAGITKMMFASSSSVYGANTRIPYSTLDRTDQPISLYAATKKANELIAYVYHHLFGIELIGMRFFTVYGPWGRPDMAYYSFTRDILDHKPIRLYNYGKSKRDFTFIDDAVECVVRLLGEETQPGVECCPGYHIYNIGNQHPVDLRRFVSILEENIGCKALTEDVPPQPGDVEETYADTGSLEDAIGYSPVTPIEWGLSRFVDWYLGYHGR